MNQDLHSLNEPSRKVRTRRILSLEERVRVIREYERKPVYQQMAYMFNCSSDQIKSIIANKESIMQYYNNIVHGSQNGAHVIRQKKIAFLGKLVHEYIRRARCYAQIPLDTEAIRLKALAFKKAIKIENFFPNNTWMQNFKTSYNLTFPIKRNPVRREEPLPSLQLNRIIAYVNRYEDKDSAGFYPTGLSGYDDDSSGFEHDVTDCDNSADEPKDEGRYGGEYNCYGYGGANSYPEVVQLESDEEDKCPPAKVLRSDAMHANSQKRMPTTVPAMNPIPPTNHISSYDEALRHLAPLEEFALHQENYRAIGLLSQLEIIFKNPPKPND